MPRSYAPVMRRAFGMAMNPASRIVAALGLGLGLLLSSCDQNAAPKAAAPPPSPVTVSQPVEKTVKDWDEYTGHLQSPETANVAARVSGLIVTAPFREGALVKKGDLLFQLDDRPFKADLDSKMGTVTKDEAAVTLARADAARSEDLLKQKAVSKQEVDTNDARLQQAIAQLGADKAATESAQLALDWTKVTAPISGRVSKINVTVGNQVTGGVGQSTLLTTIVSVDPMYCYVPIPERAFLRYQEFAEKEKHAPLREAKIPCYIQLENESTFPHAGFIDFIDNSLDVGTGTIQLRGVFPNKDSTLTPGIFARMRINRSNPYKTVLIPEIAIGTEQNERFVLTVDKDNTVVSKPVKLGTLFGSLRSITTGLTKEDRVIVNGLQQALPGSKVEPTSAPISPDALHVVETLAEPGSETKTPSPAQPGSSPKDKS